MNVALDGCQHDGNTVVCGGWQARLDLFKRRLCRLGCHEKPRQINRLFFKAFPHLVQCGNNVDLHHVKRCARFEFLSCKHGGAVAQALGYGFLQFTPLHFGGCRGDGRCRRCGRLRQTGCKTDICRTVFVLPVKGAKSVIGFQHFKGVRIHNCR